MATRADFYIGKGESAKWLGSISWEGHPWNIPKEISRATSVEQYKEEVENFLKSRDDSVDGQSGEHWPWPWNDSKRTDYSYTFGENKVEISHLGGPWVEQLNPKGYEFPTKPKQVFPDMTSRKMSFVGEKSGLIVVNHTEKV